MKKGNSIIPGYLKSSWKGLTEDGYFWVPFKILWIIIEIMWFTISLPIRIFFYLLDFLG